MNHTFNLNRICRTKFYLSSIHQPSVICLPSIYQLPYFLNLKNPQECNRKFIWCSVDHKLNIIFDNPGKKISVSLQSTQMTKREKHCNYKTKILRLRDVHFGVDDLLYTWRKTSHCVCIVRRLLPFKTVHCRGT